MSEISALEKIKDIMHKGAMITILSVTKEATT